MARGVKIGIGIPLAIVIGVVLTIGGLAMLALFGTEGDSPPRGPAPSPPRTRSYSRRIRGGRPPCAALSGEDSRCRSVRGTDRRALRRRRRTARASTPTSRESRRRGPGDRVPRRRARGPRPPGPRGTHAAAGQTFWVASADGDGARNGRSDEGDWSRRGHERRRFGGHRRRGARPDPRTSPFLGTLTIVALAIGLPCARESGSRSWSAPCGSDRRTGVGAPGDVPPRTRLIGSGRWFRCVRRARRRPPLSRPAVGQPGRTHDHESSRAQDDRDADDARPARGARRGRPTAQIDAKTGWHCVINAERHDST